MAEHTIASEQILNMSYPFEIEISQSKSGSEHKFIVKSLKFRGDAAFEVVEEATKALTIMKKNIDAINAFGDITEDNIEQYNTLISFLP
tara:strand:- start:1914 stop:2180 length:267 start_codon:yes stop_codon:yes gene_type:complete